MTVWEISAHYSHTIRTLRPCTCPHGRKDAPLTCTRCTQHDRGARAHARTRNNCRRMAVRRRKIACFRSVLEPRDHNNRRRAFHTPRSITFRSTIYIILIFPLRTYTISISLSSRSPWPSAIDHILLSSGNNGTMSSAELCMPPRTYNSIPDVPIHGP